MLSVQNYNVSSKSVAFKANEENNNNKPFQTHAGLKTGVAAGVVGGGAELGLGLSANKFLNLVKENPEDLKNAGLLKDFVKATINFMKRIKKGAKYSVAESLAVSVGVGALIDHIANKKHASVAELKKDNENKDVLMAEPRANTTRNENVYYKSNNGKKYGTLLGAVIVPLEHLVGSKILKVKATPQECIMAGVVGAVGGFVLGAITDKCSNNAARKAADKEALEA